MPSRCPVNRRTTRAGCVRGVDMSLSSPPGTNCPPCCARRAQANAQKEAAHERLETEHDALRRQFTDVSARENRQENLRRLTEQKLAAERKGGSSAIGAHRARLLVLLRRAQLGGVLSHSLLRWWGRTFPILRVIVPEVEHDAPNP